MNYRRWKCFMMVLALAAGLTACKAPAGEGTGTAAYPGTRDADMVVLDVTSEPGEMNSMRITDVIAVSVLNHCMSGLYRLDAQDNPVPDMAESCNISEDKTVYTIHLRKDGKWSNGEPVTANDFYFSWVSQMQQETGSAFASYFYENIKNGTEYYEGTADVSALGLKVVDDYTLEIEWSQPTVTGLNYLAMPAYYPVNQKAYESIGEADYAKEADKIVTNGPYNLTEWVHNDHMLLTKNADYYDADTINIEKVKLVMIGDVTTRFNSFQAGELDLCSIYSAQIEQLKKSGMENIPAYKDGGSWYFSFNTEDALLSNMNLRKALAYSVDTQSLLDHVISDGSVAADALVPGVIIGTDGKTYAEARGSLFAYDLDKGKEYLAQALTELGISASELKLTLSCTDSSYNQTQAAYIQQQWKQNLGIDVEIRVQPYKALVEVKQSGEHQIVIDAWAADLSDAMSFLKIFVTGDPSNYCNYSSPAYDALVKQAIQEGDAGKRQDLMIQAEKLLMEDMPIGPLYFTCTSYMVSDKLEGLVRTPFQYFSVRNGATIKASK